MRGYGEDPFWRAMQEFLPRENRLTEQTMPREYALSLCGMNIHVDHYRKDAPKGTVILFHGVGGNGRLLSFIALPLWKNGYEIICPDLPLYGYTVTSGKIDYPAWLSVGTETVRHYRERGTENLFLFGLSAGGMLAYQVANECTGIKGIIATCILDQRNRAITRKTAVSPLAVSVGLPLMKAFRHIAGNVKIPMKFVANMKAIANNKDLAALLMKDTKSSGVNVPLEFVYTMLNPEIRVEPEEFISCPFLLVHPAEDRWTDISLSRMFFDRLGCEKKLVMLEGAGHFPVEENGLKQMEKACVEFLDGITG